MNILILLVPAALLLGLFFLICFIYANQSGQFDDLQTPAIRILEDDNKGENNDIRKA